MKEIERQRERALKLDEINNRINDLDKEHDNMNRNIVFGNPLNSPEYQKRVIDFHDRKYLEDREKLERERKDNLN